MHSMNSAVVNTIALKKMIAQLSRQHTTHGCTESESLKLKVTRSGDKCNFKNLAFANSQFAIQNGIFHNKMRELYDTVTLAQRQKTFLLYCIIYSHHINAYNIDSTIESWQKWHEENHTRTHGVQHELAGKSRKIIKYIYMPVYSFSLTERSPMCICNTFRSIQNTQHKRSQRQTP